MAETKLVWIASMPRSGSMWAFNVARALLQEAGREVHPAQVPKDDAQMVRCAREGLADPDPRRTWVLKVHDRIPPDFERSRFVVTRRDLRDALVSYMRFLRCDFPRAFEMIAAAPAFYDTYDRAGSERVLLLDYGQIVDAPAAAAGRIAEFLELTVEVAARERIAERFSKANVQRLVQDTEQALERRHRAGQEISRDEIVFAVDGSVRAFDRSTGFQSGHVSDYRDGDWRHLLSPDQQSLIHDSFGDWLRARGYNVD